MCLDDQFRLCTCDPDQLKPEEIGWVLSRIDKNLPLPDNLAKGKIMPWQYFTSPDMKTIEHVIEELNKGECFDCELSGDPAVEYRLKLRHQLTVLLIV